MIIKSVPDPESFPLHRVVARLEAPDLPFPSEKRPLAGRRVFPVASPADAPPTRLFWESGGNFPEGGTLRFTAATDERGSHRVRVATARDGALLGHVDVLFACPGQVFEFPLPPAAASALSEGLILSLEEGPPLWLIAPGPHAPDPVLPHLFYGQGAADREAFLRLFCSGATLQPCDWMGVCVLDGLRDWSLRGRKDAAQALAEHLDVFFHPRTGQREDFCGRPCDDRPGGPESAGPFAVLALSSPGHPALCRADEGFEKFRHPELGVIATHTLVTESCYNMAYPMMALALQRGDAELRERALQQLRVSKARLADPDDLYLRFFVADGSRTFKNWSRGIAWYALGMVRTLSLLPAEERPTELTDEVGRIAAWVSAHQQPDGLWPCFLKESGVSPDSSGSAGIAAAIALAVKEGMTDSRWLDTARRACDGLMNRTRADGWLCGTSQSNKPQTQHLDIQRHPFRVIAPWGMGMLAQLLAALPETSADPKPS